MKVVAIYNPPTKGLPYLVASFTETGAEILQAADEDTARGLMAMKLNERNKAPKRESRRSTAEAL